MEELDEFYDQYGEDLMDRLPFLAGATFVKVEDMGDPQEVLAATGNGKGDSGLILVWEQFVEDINTGGRDNYHSKITGSVAILSKGSNREAVRLAYRTGRKQAMSVLSLMIADAESGRLSEEYIEMEVQSFPLDKIRVSTSWYGYGLQFTWFVPVDLTLDPADNLSA